MKRIFIIIILMLSTASIMAQEASKPYLRYPCLSPDGKTICFSCKGDLWLVPVAGGDAKRLTVHPAEDIMPQFSPDGSRILFSSDRYDNYDLYIMPVSGGEPERLTYYTGRDIGTGWTPDGDTVIFYSFRDRNYDIFKVSLQGETPVALTGGIWIREFFGKITPDGKKLVFNNGSSRTRWWKNSLFGGANTDIWILDLSAPDFKLDRITDDDRHEIWPIYDQGSETIFFVTNRDSLPNIWKKDLKSGAESKLTDFSDDGVQWLNSNPQMDKLVFEQAFSIWYFDPSSGDPRKVNINLATDTKTNPIKEFTYKGNISQYDISPDGKLAALIIRGELFVIPTEEPKFARRLTFTPQREQHPCFGADSKTIYYSSDRNGNYDIFAYNLADKSDTQITSSPENETKPLCSPDSGKLVYYRGLGKTMLYDLKSGKEIDSVMGLFVDLAVEPDIEYDFSPDSRYLTMTMAMETYETNIWITDFNSDPINVSQLADYNIRPRFSKDGKLLYFSSYMPEYLATYKVELTPKAVEFDEDRLDSLLMDKPDKKEDKKDKDKDKEEKKVSETKIDLRDIHKRVSKAIDLTASQSSPVLTPDGEKYLFIADILGKPEIWSINAEDDDPDLTQLTHSGKAKSYLTVSSDSKQAYFLEGGNLKQLDISAKKAENLNFTAEMDVVIEKENRQKYEEAWAMLNQYFYDPAYHGTDWRAVREKYEPLIGELETEEEFRNVIFEMMGELKASHLYIYSKQSGPKKEVSTPYYGFHLDYNELDNNGLYRVGLVLPNSPAALSEPAVKTGDYILAINGQFLRRETNIYPLLNGLIGKKTILTMAESPEGKPYEVELKGADFTPVYDLDYDYWVETRRRMVDSLSGGMLAYLHIRAMNQPALEKFKLELVNLSEDKEGVVIDVRHNGGGNIAVHLLGILIKEPYIYRNFVGYPITSENKMRSKALEKPSILLIDNGSGSNSEIFAEGFRKLGLGKIVGTRTSGGVIGTASFTLLDGTRIRRPSWGCYTTDMENLELVPRYPDITVEINLEDEINGRDPQLERAVAELLGGL
jgi:tricorn protease